MEENENWIVYKTNMMSKTISTFLGSLDRTIHKNFKDSGIETRPVKSNGLWCSVLIPLILLIYTHTQPVSYVYKKTAYLSIGLLCYSFLFIVFISISSLVVREASYGGCLASSLIATVFLYLFGGQEIYAAFSVSLICIVAYYILLRFSLITFPKSFTIGELMITQQSVVLFTFMLLNQLMVKQVDEETRIILVTVFVALLSVGSLILVLSLVNECSRTLVVFMTSLTLAGLMALGILHIVFGQSFLFKLFGLIFNNPKRIKLLIAWLCLLLLTVAFLVGHALSRTKATTVTRKPFHVCAALVFISGILWDIQLMRLAAGSMLALIILVEAIRILNIQYISAPLQTAFEVYKDEKDCGPLALTPLYLYVGLCCPLALVPGAGGRGEGLTRLAGSLAAGVGDSAASWAGSRYGVNRWPGSNRTKEGTICNILSQIITVYVLVAFDLLESRSAILRTAIAATITALVEAKTEQVDNLILPLVMILGFQCTFFLAN